MRFANTLVHSGYTQRPGCLPGWFTLPIVGYDMERLELQSFYELGGHLANLENATKLARNVKWNLAVLDPKRICTSIVERQNLTMRMQIRRLTRLTNAFSKKWDNLWAALCLHFAWYNFVRVHRSLRVTPAMQAGIADHAWGMGELLR